MKTIIAKPRKKRKDAKPVQELLFKEPDAYRHPQIRDYMSLAMQAYQAWHHAKWGEHVSNEAREEAAGRARVLRAREQAFWDKIMRDLSSI